MDSLSDLAGVEEFETLLSREELRRARTGEVLAVAVLDVDGLRDVNARHGAAAGTEMLRRCAETLRGSLRAVDELARTGADEFSVLLHATDARHAAIWAERFEDMLDPITCAIGIADTAESATLMGAVTTARRRMEFVQTMRKVRRAHGSAR